VTEQLSFFSTGEDLAEARRLFLKNLDSGAVCPLCRRFTKRYHRKLNAGMARILIAIYRMCKKKNTDCIHVSHVFLERQKNAVAQEYSKLKYWGLLLPIPSEDPKEKKEQRGSGWWRLTAAGKEFVQGVSKVPKYILLVNNEHEGMAGDLISIRDCLGSKFNYDELMKGL